MKQVAICLILVLSKQLAAQTDQAANLNKTLLIRNNWAQMVMQGNLTPQNGNIYIALPACVEAHGVSVSNEKGAMPNVQVKEVPTSEISEPLGTQAQLIFANVGKKIMVDVAESSELVDYSGVILASSPSSELLYLQTDSNSVEVLPIKNITHLVFSDKNGIYTQKILETQKMLVIPSGTAQNLRIVFEMTQTLKAEIAYTLGFNQQNSILKTTCNLTNTCLNYKDVGVEIISNNSNATQKETPLVLPKQNLAQNMVHFYTLTDRNIEANLKFVARKMEDSGGFGVQKFLEFKDLGSNNGDLKIVTQNDVYNRIAFWADMQSVVLEDRSEDIVLVQTESEAMPSEVAATTEPATKRKRTEANAPEPPKQFTVNGTFSLKNTLNNDVNVEIMGGFDVHKNNAKLVQVNGKSQGLDQPLRLELKANQVLELPYTLVITE